MKSKKLFTIISLLVIVVLSVSISISLYAGTSYGDPALYPVSCSCNDQTAYEAVCEPTSQDLCYEINGNRACDLAYGVFRCLFE